ncbi:MAG TPA: hypothetical protein VF550_04730, partial [Polyangia bacterium]
LVDMLEPSQDIYLRQTYRGLLEYSAEDQIRPIFLTPQNRTGHRPWDRLYLGIPQPFHYSLPFHCDHVA